MLSLLILMIKKGINPDIKVIINAGTAYTSWSGAENWIDEEVLTTIRKWIDNGGGFIGLENQPLINTRENSFN